MDFEAKTIDEELIAMADTFDASIAPKSIWRNNNNKLYLVLKSIGAGFSKIRDVVLSLKYRFDARFCSDDDLESAMFVVGEKRIGGKSSMLRVLVINTNSGGSEIIEAGTYVYTSTDGQPFYCTTESITIVASGYAVLLFASRDIGSWYVEGMTNAAVAREDGAVINAFLEFETFDNTGSLGRLAETNFEIRQRILTDTQRQDTLKELELAIRALPTIFECNLIFNPDAVNTLTLENGEPIAPKELYILITGVPTQDLADLIMSREVYKTHVVTLDKVLYYNNPLFIADADGKNRYPVYYDFHSNKNFYLTIYYKYNRLRGIPTNIEDSFKLLLRKYQSMTTHIDEINEPLIYSDLENHGIAGVTLEKVYIQESINGVLTSVVNVIIPKYSIPMLPIEDGISFVAEAV